MQNFFDVIKGCSVRIADLAYNSNPACVGDPAFVSPIGLIFKLHAMQSVVEIAAHKD